MKNPHVEKPAEIKIIPMGDIDDELTAAITKGLSWLHVGVKVVSPIPLPEKCYKQERHQFSAECVLDCLEKEFAETDERVLGVVDGDLYAKGSNFIFGQTKLGSRVAIMSTYRLDPIFYGKPKNSRILEERAVKEAVHEVCHTYDLDHCSNPKCVMYFSDSILETDKKSKILCEKCKNKLEL